MLLHCCSKPSGALVELRRAGPGVAWGAYEQEELTRADRVGWHEAQNKDSIECLDQWMIRMERYDSRGVQRLLHYGDSRQSGVSSWEKIGRLL